MRIATAGSWICIAIGAAVAIAALSLIGYSLASFGGYLGLVDHLLNGVLLGVAAGGALLALFGRKALHS